MKKPKPSEEFTKLVAQVRFANGFSTSEYPAIEKIKDCVFVSPDGHWHKGSDVADELIDEFLEELERLVYHFQHEEKDTENIL